MHVKLFSVFPALPQVQGLVSEGDGTLQAQLLEMLRLLLDAETMQAVSGQAHTRTHSVGPTHT